jgi:hypothetical protein
MMRGAFLGSLDPRHATAIFTRAERGFHGHARMDVE